MNFHWAYQKQQIIRIYHETTSCAFFLWIFRFHLFEKDLSQSSQFVIPRWRALWALKDWGVVNVASQSSHENDSFFSFLTIPLPGVFFPEINRAYINIQYSNNSKLRQFNQNMANKLVNNLW